MDWIDDEPERPLGKLNAPFNFAQDRIVSQDRVNPVRHRFQQELKELPRGPLVNLVDKLGYCKLTRAVDADEQVEFPSVV